MYMSLNNTNSSTRIRIIRPSAKHILQKIGFEFNEDNYKLGNGRYSKVLKAQYISSRKTVNLNYFYFYL